jgi:thiaminase
MAHRQSFTRTLEDLEQLANSDFVKRKQFDDFSLFELKKLKSDDFRHICKKKIEELSTQYLKTVEKLPEEEVMRFDQSEVKKLTNALTDFRDQCKKDGLSVREFEEESVKFITDKYKRFFFSSKWAQRLYKINNSIVSTSLGYWGYRAVGVLGTTNRFLLQTELSKSFLPIAYFTGVTCRFWAYITSPLPPVSRVFDGISHIAMSPIWLAEFLINKVTGPIFKATPLKTEIPLNITGEVAAGTGLTWEKLTHTFEFVKNMTQNWETS